MAHTRLIIIAIVAGQLILACGAMAGGSISWDDARIRIQKEDPEFLELVERVFDIRRVGEALRVGHDASGTSTVEGVDVGTRMPPYEFLAKPRGSQSMYTLHLTFAPSVTEGHAWQI